MIKMIKNYYSRNGSIAIVYMILLSVLAIIIISAATVVLDNRVGIEKTYRRTSALNIAEGGVEKAIWELKEGNSSYSGETSSLIPGGQFEVQVAPGASANEKVITSIGYIPSKANPMYTKTVRVKVTAQDNTSGPFAFNYGAQVGTLGLDMSNNSKISGTNGAKGNVYSAGSISGGNGAEITGDVYMSGAGNEIEGVKIGHDARGHKIEECTVTHDAYYTIIQSTTVGGTKHPGSTDPAAIDLPITTATINAWKSDAAADGTLTTQTITNGVSKTLGPVKINGNLTVDNNATLTIKGTIWVTGTIDFSNNAIIKLDSSYGVKSGLIIADGKITVSNNVTMQGSGNAKSFIMVISMNSNSTVGNPAINAGNNSSAVVYYAPNGMVEISNNATLRAVTGKGLNLSNGAQIQYDSGLASTEFYEGPGGTWQVTEWQEVR